MISTLKHITCNGILLYYSLSPVVFLGCNNCHSSSSFAKIVVVWGSVRRAGLFRWKEEVVFI